jgi:hypothetical protein
VRALSSPRRFAVALAFAVETLGEATLSEERLLQGLQLAAKEVTGLVDDLDVADAMLPSAMFCTPLRAACTI